MKLLPFYNSGEKPTSSQLLQQDLGINLADKILFFKDLSQKIVEIGSGTSKIVKGTGTEYAIKQPDGTLIIVIPSVDVAYSTTTLLTVDISFPVNFSSLNYSLSLDTVSFNMTGSDMHKALTSVTNKAVDGATLNYWSNSVIFATGDTVTFSATLTGRWK